jgi:hypothetical protein
MDSLTVSAFRIQTEKFRSGLKYVVSSRNAESLEVAEDTYLVDGIGGVTWVRFHAVFDVDVHIHSLNHLFINMTTVGWCPCVMQTVGGYGHK